MKVEGLTPEQIGRALQTLEELERIGTAIREHAIRLAHAGTVIPGYEAGWTNARRQWGEEAKASAVLGKLGLPKEERYVTELLSPAQAEKALRKKGKWPKKPRGSAGEDFAHPFQGFITLTERNPTIVRASADSTED